MSISIDASIRTCKVETGEAQRIESDRFLNPNNMVCVPWNGYNSKGQSVCADSFYTKTPGCNSADDRVHVENDLRPNYAAYINLNMQGLQGDIYGNKLSNQEADSANKWQQSRHDITGSFGNQFKSSNYQSCGINSYEKAMAHIQQANRQAAMANSAYKSNARRPWPGW